MIPQTILGAGIFSSYAQSREIHVAGLWWFWAAITFPLTGVVLLSWGLFCWRKQIREQCARMAVWRKDGGNGSVEAQK